METPTSENVIRTSIDCGGIIVITYSWTGLSPEENYEEYLIHIYSPSYHQKKKEALDDARKVMNDEAEIERILHLGRRTKQRQNKIDHLQRQIERSNRQTLEDRLWWDNTEKQVMKCLKQSRTLNKKTKHFDLPEFKKQTEKDNIEYELNKFIFSHKTKVENKKRKEEKNCVRCGEYDINIKKRVLANDLMLFCKKCLNREEPTKILKSEKFLDQMWLLIDVSINKEYFWKLLENKYPEYMSFMNDKEYDRCHRLYILSKNLSKIRGISNLLSRRPRNRVAT